ncbi:UbiA prenyltransferase family-domain-containing protein [Mycena crocata]|nr:UbiA prenyltransferase family-domain-containing protein [Mycena crocata]
MHAPNKSISLQGYADIIRSSKPSVQEPNSFISTVQGYADLIRFTKPAATIIIFLPFGHTLALASYNHNLPLAEIFRLAGFFLAWAFSGRSLACTINDICDRDIDGHVARTKTRPLPSGRVSLLGARVYLFAQVCLFVALFWHMSNTVVLQGFISLGLTLSYPLMKRLINHPQAWLGVAANYGAVLAWAVLGKTGPDIRVVSILMVGLMAWTMCFDTIYALEDRADDSKLGVGSSAITAFGYMHKFLWSCAIVFVTCLTTVGVLNHQGPVFFIVSVGLTALSAFSYLLRLDLNKPETYANSLPLGARVSFLVLGGLVGDCVVSRVVV